MASDPQMAIPSGSTRTGTSPAGLMARNASRRSQTLSTRISNSSFFSARLIRALRHGGESQS